MIDALYGNLPFSKQDLGFKGLFVCRSVVGLLDMYEQQLAPLQATRPGRAGHPVANLLRRASERRGRPLYPVTFATRIW